MINDASVKILVVDDDHGDVLLMERYLAASIMLKYEVTSVSNYGDAVTALEQNNYDAALVDYHLGPDSGIDLIREVTASENTTAMILLTGQGNTAADVAAASAGAAGYVDKASLSPETIDRVLRYALLNQAALLRQREARKAAEEIAKAKTEMLSQISHEFRTPLNAIIGFADMIESEILGPVGQPRYTEFANDISNSGQHLLGLINQLLLSAQMDNTSLILEPETVDIAKLAQQAAAMVRQLASRQDIDLQCDLPPELECVADERAVRQICINLLSNAIKFTQQGTVRLSAGKTGDNRIFISVTDTGIGIEESKLSRLTEAFFQVNDCRSRPGSGNGLGLSIVRELAERHGGDVQIESRYGEGTTVI
ncbi:MAG: hybrid sensor histidine kinase/response regulator, partial [Rhodospirillales bacterium]